MKSTNSQSNTLHHQKLASLLSSPPKGTPQPPTTSSSTKHAPYSTTDQKNRSIFLKSIEQSCDSSELSQSAPTPTTSSFPTHHLETNTHQDALQPTVFSNTYQSNVLDSTPSIRKEQNHFEKKQQSDSKHVASMQPSKYNLYQSQRIVVDAADHSFTEKEDSHQASGKSDDASKNKNLFHAHQQQQQQQQQQSHLEQQTQQQELQQHNHSLNRQNYWGDSNENITKNMTHHPSSHHANQRGNHYPSSHQMGQVQHSHSNPHQRQYQGTNSRDNYQEQETPLSQVYQQQQQNVQDYPNSYQSPYNMHQQKKNPFNNLSPYQQPLFAEGYQMHSNLSENRFNQQQQTYSFPRQSRLFNQQNQSGEKHSKFGKDAGRSPSKMYSPHSKSTTSSSVSANRFLNPMQATVTQQESGVLPNFYEKKSVKNNFRANSNSVEYQQQQQLFPRRGGQITPRSFEKGGHRGNAQFQQQQPEEYMNQQVKQQHMRSQMLMNELQLRKIMDDMLDLKLNVIKNEFKSILEQAVALNQNRENKQQNQPADNRGNQPESFKGDVDVDPVVGTAAATITPTSSSSCSDVTTVKNKSDVSSPIVVDRIRGTRTPIRKKMIDSDDGYPCGLDIIPEQETITTKKRVKRRLVDADILNVKQNQNKIQQMMSKSSQLNVDISFSDQSNSIN